MKELLLIGTTVFALTSSSIGTAISMEQTPRPERGNHVSVSIMHKAELRAEAQAEFIEQQRLEENSKKIESAIEKLKSHVGKTWYVFSGNTPSGWDCSGLTMWFYDQIDIELEHRASKQQSAGVKSDSPKLGDLVVFKYNKSKSAYHVGIYVGNGKMIHAPKHGHVTRIESVDKFAGKYSVVEYRNILESI